MRRLNHAIRSRLGAAKDRDAGATIVFVAVILVALLALTAFAVDFGRMWEERRQLQNGADAAALAIAEDCARGLCDATYDEYGVAETYVDANARDGAARAFDVDLDMDAQTVTVRNATEDPGGENTFEMLFAGAVGFDGFTVGASATVAWGTAVQAETIPIIISDCEWIREDEGWPGWDDGDLPQQPDYDADPVVLTFHDGNSTDDCNAQAGQDGEVLDLDGDDRLPGGFGWLNTDGDCVASVHGIVTTDDGGYDDYGWVGSDTGSSPSQGCGATELKDLLLDEDDAGELIGKTLFIPYFNDIWTGPANGSGPCGNTGKCYHIAGYGAFHVTGYKLSGAKKFKEYADPPMDEAPCQGPGQGDERCLAGYFVAGVYPFPSDIGGIDRGITVIKFTG